MNHSRKAKKRRATGEGAQAEARTPKSEVPTQPLPNIARLTFEGFLARYQLSMLDVARTAGVRLLTIWRVMRGEPVSEDQARQVYAGLERLAGVPYRGRIRLRPESKERRGSSSPGSSQAL